MGIRKIAKLANVSTATVSRVLNTPKIVKRDTRNKVLEIAKELEYRKYNANYQDIVSYDEIAVIMPDVLNTFFARVLEGIVKQSKKLNFSVNIYFSHDNAKSELEAVETLLQRQTKGVILVIAKNQESKSMETIKQLNKAKIPFVLVDRDLQSTNHSGVFLSNANAIYDASNLLLKDSYKNIHIIAGQKDSINSIQRIEGFKQSYLKNGLEIKENVIHQSDFTIKDGLEITKKLLNQIIIPEAIISTTNQITIGCLKAISEKGLIVGKDIKLFSFNKLDASYVNNFNISYIEHPAQLMGEKSVIILNNKFAGTKGAIREIMSYKVHY